MNLAVYGASTPAEIGRESDALLITRVPSVMFRVSVR
jgi:hypothetical protein